MLVVGILTGVGLWLLGVPLALSLATIAAAMTFVPNLGPLISLVPAALLAITVKPVLALYVVVLFAGIQIFESYLLTPIIHEKTIKLPPALTVFMQLLLPLRWPGSDSGRTTHRHDDWHRSVRVRRGLPRGGSRVVSTTLRN